MGALRLERRSSQQYRIWDILTPELSAGSRKNIYKGTYVLRKSIGKLSCIRERVQNMGALRLARRFSLDYRIWEVLTPELSARP